MLFNSYIFWAFFAVVMLLYFRLPHKYQNRMLLVASYIFYGYWDYRFLSLIFISTVVDYFVALNIAKQDDAKLRKQLLLLSIFTNLGFLGFFKYYNFFSNEFAAMLGTMGIDVSLPVLNIILPVGISFYTFQTLSYTIDTYRNKVQPTDKFLDFALYVSFFPQLVAGPIERASHLLPQILQVRKLDGPEFSEGLFLVISGLFKKVVIADNMAPIVNTIFSKPVNELTGFEVLVGLYAFAFQIYGDFSGYSSIAKGVARWMGFDLMWNFRNPYFATSPSDFWSRWHISLSTWIRDYIYIPLGGGRLGNFLTFRNLVLTMFLGGLWHGAGWTFIIWGLFHGAILVVYHAIEAAKGKDYFTQPTSLGRHILFVVILFHLTCISWLLFRAESMQQVVDMVYLLATDYRITDYSIYVLGNILFFVVPLMFFEYVTERKNDLLYLVSANPAIQYVSYLYMVLMLLFFVPLQKQVFIYFQF
ncbi:MAG: MBOAT family protein [Candidatus Thiodiazotropha sp. (ex. Lucinisca nassula)]|nr:MBOAT family protein [Candidatus Thiodiazotropha sp. (ex. Lucinisca nassula)]MBW9268033.1 MBOAT family protein [Candidatus Thiodiazotropha sp. (ex. Lucinisca nassula)]